MCVCGRHGVSEAKRTGGENTKGEKHPAFSFHLPDVTHSTPQTSGEHQVKEAFAFQTREQKQTEDSSHLE